MPRSHTMSPDRAARFEIAVNLAADMATLSTPEVAKLAWLVEQYTQLRPEGQAAIDAALAAFPRRPGSTTPPRA